MNIVSLHEQGIEASKKALKKFLEDWNKNTGGNKYGQPMYCGFAGVVILCIYLLIIEEMKQR